MLKQTESSPAAQADAGLAEAARGGASNLEQLTAFVSQAAAAFYLAESPHNPAVQTYWDALHYIATALSVGYANIFPVTAAGKAIGALVMMVGPALSARALEAAPGATRSAGDLDSV